MALNVLSIGVLLKIRKESSIVFLNGLFGIKFLGNVMQKLMWFIIEETTDRSWEPTVQQHSLMCSFDEAYIRQECESLQLKNDQLVGNIKALDDHFTEWRLNNIIDPLYIPDVPMNLSEGGKVKVNLILEQLRKCDREIQELNFVKSQHELNRWLVEHNLEDCFYNPEDGDSYDHKKNYKVYSMPYIEPGEK